MFGTVCGVRDPSGFNIMVHPLRQPRVQFQSGEYSSPDPFWMSSSKISSSMPSAPPFAATGFQFSSPSTINSFFSTSSTEKPYQKKSHPDAFRKGTQDELTIIMEGKVIKTLRSVIKRRSPFAEMHFRNDNENVILIKPIDGCDAEVFYDFLLYLSSGKVDNMSLEKINGLYRAARKFMVPELKEKCVNFLKKSLSVDTITDIIRSVNIESELSHVVTDFFVKNKRAIKETDKWKRFTSEERDLAFEFLLKVVA